MSGKNKLNNQLTTTCCYCGVGCGLLLNKDKNDNVTLQGDTEHPVNKGMLCSKGMNLHHTVNDKSNRLLYPQMRYNKNMPMQRVSWDDALTRAAAVFKTFIDKYGPDSVAIYASGQCLTEEYYVLNKLMKGFIGSNNIDTNSRLCMSSAVAAYKMALGEDSVPICYEDIELADCFYVTGANPAWCHPILWRRIQHHKLPCLVGFGLSRAEAFADQIMHEERVALERAAPFDADERAAQLYGFMRTKFDESGRFIMPEHLSEQAQIGDVLYFHGGGANFTIWAPDILFAMGAGWDSAKATCRALMADAGARGRRK